MTPTQALDPQIDEQQPDAGELDQPYGEDNQELPEQLVNALRECVKEFQGQEKYLRRREVMKDRRNRFYERGFQHIFWNNSQNPGYVQISPGGTTVGTMGQNIQAPNYVDDYNIFQPYERVIESILTQNPPGIDFRPINLDRAEDVDAAETAEGYRHVFDRANSVKQIQTNIVRMMCVSGRTVLWTRTEADAEKFGLNDDGTPKQMEISTVHGTLESKVPILAKSQEAALYCFLADDIDVKQAKAKYPWKAEKIQAGISGLGENAYERLARLGVLQGSRSEMLSAESYTHLVTRTNCWIRPNSFTGDRYDNASEQSPGMTVGDELKQLFPQGCHVTFVGDTYICSKPESMDDALVIGFPYEGDGMNRLALLDSMVVVQDAFNDAMNAAREVFDVGWPSTWVGCDDMEFDAISRQRADPYALRMFKTPLNGTKLQDSFFREPNPELPATFVEFMQNLSGELSQFILAAPPALFGAAMEDQKTASGYAQARSQAMGQQGLVWGQMQYMMSRMYYQAALCAAKNPDHAKGVVVPGEKGGTASIDIISISKGKFGAYPDEDSSFPESTSAKRATLMQIATLLAPTPLGMQMLQVPKNLKAFLTLNGFPELTIPEAESYDKQMFEIEQLLLTSPVPPDPQMQQEAMIDHAAAATLAGPSFQPVPPPPMLPPTSTVQVQDYDFHQWEAAACQDWLNSSDCRRAIAEGNQAGVDNVVLHWREHVARIPPPPMSAPMPASHPAIPPQAAGGPLLPASVQAPGAPGTATM